jgi:hypothetical protein
MPQVNIYVTGTDHEQFTKYAWDFGLDATALANLLLTRELRIGRLTGLRSLVPQRGDLRGAKVTAHLSRDRRVAFATRAKSCGLSLSKAGAILILAELKEHWLKKAVDN